MLIAVLNSLLSYLLLVFVIVAVGAVGIYIGFRLRKRKDAGKKAEKAEVSDEAET